MRQPANVAECLTPYEHVIELEVFDEEVGVLDDLTQIFEEHEEMQRIGW